MILSGVIFDQLEFKRTATQAELFAADNKLGNLAIEVGKEVTPKMDGDVLFYFTYAPQGDQAALNTAVGVLAANLMLNDIETILYK